ncbi:MAG TPA: PDZ domain-containing protein [Candidatus Sulfotelmatobacter sp.]|nr:PDZ domain-containing protein [Candidatus Sulfotelmatobacter sp.]
MKLTPDPIRFPLRLAGLLVALCVASVSLAQSPAAVNYVVSFPSAERHLVHVLVILPAGATQRDLQMPVWDALYQVRDFSQYVDWVRAKDSNGKLLEVRKLSSSLWEVDGAQDGAFVEYQIYADSPGPFGAQVNAHHAFLNLAQILMYSVDARDSPLTVRLKLTNHWRIATPLQAGVDTYIADNYDLLVDSPIEIGDFAEKDFDEAGAHFRVIIDADPADYDPEKIVADLHKIVAAAITWMDDRPFDTYTFFYHFPRGPAGGGMEHAYSTAIELNADSIKQSLYPFDTVTAHEFFHLWNVKRIRPQTLEPIDYTKANYTRALWFSEGVTSTAEGIIQLRAGLIDEKQYLHNLADEITELERRPAHLTQSAEESSLDAWLEGDSYYRRPQRSISYYNKGELLGIMLDLAVRDASHGQASLRELLQWMNANYAKKHRFFDDSNGVREAAEAVSHADMGWFFTKYVSGTEEIPWNDFLRSVGVRVEAVTTTVADPGFLASRNFDGPMSVVAVSAGGEAERAGLRVGDIITEMQGQLAGEESTQQLARLQPGDTVVVKVRSRRGAERELRWKVSGREEMVSVVKDLDQITPEQRARRTAWLKGEAQAGDALQPPSAANLNGVRNK